MKFMTFINWLIMALLFTFCITRMSESLLDKPYRLNMFHDRTKKYTIEGIQKAPNNESPWNYLRGILQTKGLAKFSAVEEFTQQLYDANCRSPHLLGFIIDMVEERLLEDSNQELCQKAIDICDTLAKKYDTIRKEYWNYIARNLGDLYGPKEAHVRIDE